ncbi:MAG: T9SS type A sorting domain-containing protein, partial [Bacteroidia bacterium]
RFIKFGSKLFFIADNGNDGVQLWASDGTAPGTHQLLPTLTPTANFNALGSCFVGFTTYKTDLYFGAEYDAHQCELWRLDTAAVNGIKQFSLNSIQVSIYPNPNNGIFTIQTLQFENTQIEIYNVIGEKIVSQLLQHSNTELDLTDVKSGVYELRFIQNNLPVYKTKLLKQ